MVGTTLKRFLQERNLNVNELSRRTGISPQTLYSIIKRDSMKIDFDMLLRLCEGLDVPVEVFYEACGGRPMAGKLPDLEEWDLVQNYRKLDPHGKRLTQLVIDAELIRAEQTAEPPSAPKTKVIPIYRTPAAAGYASPAFGEDYDDFTVDDSDPADFAFRVSGDSMEPYIPDGSIQKVRRGAIIYDGDVGLFFVDGDMKCKQYCQDYHGGVHLLSLNRDRADADVHIPPSAGITLMCFGKVLLPERVALPDM